MEVDTKKKTTGSKAKGKKSYAVVIEKEEVVENQKRKSVTNKEKSNKETKSCWY